MISEDFLERAVRIRVSFLKTSNELNIYEKRASELHKLLDDSINELTKLEQEVQANGKNTNSEVYTNKIIGILNNVEENAKIIDGLMTPLNEVLNELQAEENTLYRMIKERYPALSDDEIVKCIQERLEKENLL